MKRLVIIIAAVLVVLAVGCSKEFDDSALNNRIDSLEKRMSALETVMNAYKNSLFIKSVQRTDNVYVITFSDGSTATIANGVDGKDGRDGVDGKDGIDGDTLIDYIVIGENEVTFVLTDGRKFSIALYSALSIEFDETDLVVMSPNSTREIHYTVKSLIPDVVVETVSSVDIKAKVVETSATEGIIEVKTGTEIDEYSKVVVFVSNGEKVIMRRISFEEAELEVTDNAKKELTQSGGTLTLEYSSNMECEVVISKEGHSWIKPVVTRAVERHSISFDISPNNGMTRSATIELKASGLNFVYTITQQGYDNPADAERAALIAFYKSMNGDKWTNNTNWCSDKPLDEWYGVKTDSEGNVITLCFRYKDNLHGPIPAEIGNLTNLTILDLEGDFTGAIPQEMWSLTNLETLNLSGWDNGLNSHLSGSIPAEIGNLKNLLRLELDNNQFSGSIPVEIGNLKNLEHLDLSYNHLAGSIPVEIGNLKNLLNLNLGGNQLSGCIPSEIGNLIKLESLTLKENQLSGSIPTEVGNLTNLFFLSFYNNQLSGSIPAEIGNLNKLSAIYLANNEFSGTIPEMVQKHPVWRTNWTMIVMGNEFDLSNATIYAPEFSLKTTDGKTIDSSIYEANKYTILYQWAEWCPLSEVFTPKLVKLYKSYHNKGVDVFGWTMDDVLLALDYIDRHAMPWSNALVANNLEAPINIYSYPAINVVDSNGFIVFNCYTDDYNNLEAFLRGHIDEPDDYYVSSDYTQDGKVEVLQKATKGNGIDVVLMGDAYSDRQIADGTYMKAMQTMANNLFSEEPYKSFKDMFNVYVVNVVSATEGYEYGNTTLNGFFGGGTHVGGNDTICFQYALKAISEQRMDEALIVVAMNEDAYAGTCYMYNPTTVMGTYGSGPSVAYFPTCSDAATLSGLVLHEAGGHGFSKLADEYDHGTTISTDEINYTKTQQNDWGWWKNIDFTSDPSAVRWNYFLKDYRYTNDGLGVFEGGLTHSFGVWRPTDNSIMRYNSGGFNAPSREAIYYRIHKLAYGDSWQFNYEDFVKYDEINRKAATPARVYAPTTYKPTHPPVVVNKSWKDAK